MTSKRVINASPLGMFSPPFPAFNHFNLSSINEQSEQNNLCLADESDEQTTLQNNTLNDTLLLSNNINNIYDILSNINNINIIAQNKTNDILLITKSLSIESVKDIDTVHKILFLVRNDTYEKKIATINLTSKILFSQGKTLSWKAQLQLNRYEWDYFLTICDLKILNNLEKLNRIEYGQTQNIIYFDNTLSNSVEKFLSLMFINFDF